MLDMKTTTMTTMMNGSQRRTSRSHSQHSQTPRHFQHSQSQRRRHSQHSQQQQQQQHHSLDELDRAVLEYYFRETDSASLSQFDLSVSSKSLSVKELSTADLLRYDASSSSPQQQQSQPQSQPQRETIVLEVLEEWRNLISILKSSSSQQRGLVFTNNNNNNNNNYIPALSDAFQQLPKLDKSLYKHMKTLISSLSETATSAAAAASANNNKSSATATDIECRFVTLLEIVLSYNPNWIPSVAICRIWKCDHQLELPSDLPPVNFRRKAYRILVSLEYVPSAYGLLQACSFDSKRQTVNVQRTPFRIRKQFNKIKNSSGGANNNSNSNNTNNTKIPYPQPRYDCVSQVLNRLKDNEHVCIVIRSDKQGMGKTTLAALVASHPSIVAIYKVLWLNLPTNDLTYDAYMECLYDLCEQLNIPPNTIKWPDRVERFEEPALQRLREETAMMEARDKLATELLLRQRRGDDDDDDEQNYLLVIDDVENDKEVDLFRISERQSIIATTQNNHFDNTNDDSDGDASMVIDWTFDIGPMSVNELIDLFLREANLSPNHVIGLTKEVRTIIIKYCNYNPLTVRTVGRWYGLMYVTAGIVNGMEELINQLCTIEKEAKATAINNKDPNSSVVQKVVGTSSSSSSSGSGSSDSSESEEVVHIKGGGGEEKKDSLLDYKENQQQQELPIKNGGAGDTTEDATEDETIGSSGLVTATADKNNNLEDEGSLPPLLFDILKRILDPTNVEGNSTTVLFTLCVTSMVVVFPDPAPLDSVILLWEQILSLELDAIHEISSPTTTTTTRKPSPDDIRKRVRMIAEGLTYMGVLSVVEKDDDNNNPWVEVHHKLYKKFALRLAHQMHGGGGGGGRGDDDDDQQEAYERIVEKWNKAFVTAYFTHRLEGISDRNDDFSWGYAIKKLPYHAVRAKMFRMAESILGEEHFFHARIDSLGWDRTIDMHIKDCVDLQQAAERNDNDSTSKMTQVVSPVFNVLGALASTKALDALGTAEEKLVIEVSRVLYKVGTALAENGYFNDAVEQFESALNLAPKSEELVASILYGNGWVLLTANHSEKALKKLKASRKIMDEYDGDHVLYKEVLLLQGEALVGECEYREAAELMEDLGFWLKSDASNNKIELGTSLNIMGRLQYMMGETENSLEALSESLNWKLEAGETSSDLSLVLSLLGDMSMERGSHSDATGCYERALQVLDSLGVDPDEADHRLLRGKLEYIKSDFSVSLEALELARKAISQTPNLVMDKSAYDLRCIARCYYTHGELEATTSVLQDSLILTNQTQFSLERSSGLYDLAKCILDQCMTKEALVLLEQSLEIRIVKLGECALVMDTLRMIGIVHMSLDAPDEALPVFEKVYELTKRITPDDMERNAKVLYCIGDAVAAKKDYAEAKAKILESMALLEEGGTEQDSPDIARALHRLGDIEAAEKQLPIAFEYYTEALRIRQQHPNKREIAETLHSLGVLTRKRRDIDAALDCLLDALSARRDVGNGKETGKTLMELAHVHRLRSEMEDAIRCYEEALRLFGSDSGEEVASAFLSLGHAKLSLKRDGEVLECYERALEIRMEILGRDNMKTANVHRSLGLFQYLVLHGDESLLHLNEYMRVVEMQEKNEDEDDDDDDNESDIDYVVALMLMFDIHRASGRSIQAKSLIDLAKEECEESDEIRKELPALAEMVGRRKTAPLRKSSSSSSYRKGGLFSRLANTLMEESGTQLAVSAEDGNVLRNICFIDD